MNLASITDGHPDDRVALVSRGAPSTYGTLRAQIGGLRGALVAGGIEPGDRVAIVCANNRYFVVSYLAVLGAGAVAVPLNPASPAAELQREMAAVDARAAVVGPHGAAAFAGIERSSVPSLEWVVAPEGAGVADALAFDSLLEHEPAAVVDRAAGDLAVLVFTAGTAGRPKAAMLTHGSLLANLQQVQQVPGRTIGPDDVTFGVLPLFHIFGLNVVLGGALASGSSVVLAERFDPGTAADTIRERGVTVLPGAPPMWVAWASMPDLDRATFATVRLAASGAAKLPVEVFTAVRDRFGLEIAEGYGLTEASPVVTTSVGDDVRPGSVGRPVPGVEVRLADVDGDDALLGDPGEVWVRGANVFAGYWRDDDATREALTPDGWLRTGDMAMADEDGYLYLVDRAKDLIIVSGFNVYPAEVEEILQEHPGIRAVAVVGVPHPYTGEAVKAFVVPEGSRHLEEDEIIEYCATHLARYKCPTKVNFVESLPHGLGGKIVRRALR